MILSLPIKSSFFRLMTSGCRDCARYVCLVNIFFLCAVPLAYGQTESGIQFSGFATLGVSSENKDDLGFLRDGTQSKDPSRNTSFFPDSTIGGQLSFAFADDWRATSQLVYRDRPRYKLDESLELAFLGYRPTSGLDIRLGRVAVDMFQLSDFRRVDYANLSVRPPTEVYGWILPVSIDGGDVAYGFSKGTGFWRFKLQYGDSKPILEFPDGSELVEANFNDFVVATLTFDVDVWRVRVSYSQATPSASPLSFLGTLYDVGDLVTGPVGEEATALADAFSDASGAKVRYSQASLGYDDGDWIIDTEFTYITTTGAIIPTGTAGYLSAGRRIGAFTPYAFYSRFFTDQELYESNVDWSQSGFEVLRDAAIATLNGVQIEQHTQALGVRWDIATKVAFKAQWEQTHIEAGKFAAWAHTNDRSSSSTMVNLFSFAVNLVF